MSLTSAQDQSTPTPTPIPFYGPYDPPSYGIPEGYRGFEGSYDYPSDPAPEGDYPWTISLDGQPINTKTVGGYVAIIKKHIEGSMITLLDDTREKTTPVTWDAAKEGWYNQPWLSQLRDGIHGTYLGSSCFSPTLFPESDLKAPFTTYVLVFYNDVAARSMWRVWGKDAMSPDLFDASGANNAQFDEGSIIVKAAFTTATAKDWEPMTDALTWKIYTPQVDCTNNETKSQNPSVFPVSFFQFDIIVKDSKAAPQTGWVFSTLTYDKDLEASADLSPAAQAWEKMSILGAMWGNDPTVTSPNAPLQETWINPQSPLYARETLGWGGRLSGPNDGAVQNPPYYTCAGDGCDSAAPCASPSCEFVNTDGVNLPMSSCMSCHGTAQYPMTSFLLPVPEKAPKNTGAPRVTGLSDGLLFFETGSNEWREWFHNRPGTEAQNPVDGYTITATDYDMNLPLKVLPQWANEVCIRDKNPDNLQLCKILSDISNSSPSAPGHVEQDYQGDVVPGG